MDYRDKGTRVYLSLGSNMGDREDHLARAILGIQKFIDDMELSPVYETPPWGFESDTPFLNLCLGGITFLTKEDLLYSCQTIEKQEGRKLKAEVERYSSRPLDIDIIYFDNVVCDTEELQIPHPRMYDRKFVLEPLCDIAKNFIDPIKSKSVKKLRDDCDDNSSTVLYKKNLLTF